MAMSALGATTLSHRLETSMIAFLEQGCRFLKPVLVGDPVHAEFKVARLQRKGDKGVLRLQVSLVNQRGEQVLSGHHAYLVRCR